MSTPPCWQPLLFTDEQQLQGLEAARAAAVREKEVMEQRSNSDKEAWQVCDLGGMGGMPGRCVIWGMGGRPCRCWTKEVRQVSAGQGARSEGGLAVGRVLGRGRPCRCMRGVRE